MTEWHTVTDWDTLLNVLLDLLDDPPRRSFPGSFVEQMCAALWDLYLDTHGSLPSIPHLEDPLNDLDAEILATWFQAWGHADRVFFLRQIVREETREVERLLTAPDVVNLIGDATEGPSLALWLALSQTEEILFADAMHQKAWRGRLDALHADIMWHASRGNQGRNPASGIARVLGICACMRHVPSLLQSPSMGTLRYLLWALVTSRTARTARILALCQHLCQPVEVA